MYWGMILKSNEKYTMTFRNHLCISQAALDYEGVAAEDVSNKIYITNDENQQILACTLRKSVCEQAMLNLKFARGEKICILTIGSGNVSLSGYLSVCSIFTDNGKEEENVAEDLNEIANGKLLKNKKISKADQEEDDNENEDDMEDAMLKSLLEMYDDDDGDGDDDDEVEADNQENGDKVTEKTIEDEREDNSNDDDKIEEPKKKVVKLEKKEVKPQQHGIIGNAQKSKKEKEAKKQQQQTPAADGERTITGGVKIKDTRVGNGAEAKTGKIVQVCYEGRLESNNKTFDSLRNGTPFKFQLGHGNVIKGWNVGIVGMKVGGKRHIICPPHMAFGTIGSSPTIPPNSTLIFEVELKDVN